MKLRITKLELKDWQGISESAHLAVFDKVRPKEFDRVDYTLVGVDSDTDTPVGYITCHELDMDTLYLQFGGALPNIKGSVHTYACYRAGLNFLKDRYKRLTTYVENTNAAYLKMAISEGFRPVGIRYYNKNILVELLLGEG